MTKKDEINVAAFWKRIKTLFVGEEATMMGKEGSIQTGGDARR